MEMELIKSTGRSQLLSKKATSDEHGENSPYFDGWKAYDRDPFHPTQNPHGVIQMGLAENQLPVDLIKEWIKKNPAASICTAEGLHAFKERRIVSRLSWLARIQTCNYIITQYYMYAVAKFMAKSRGGRVSFDPDRIVMAGGATGANEMLMFCLADPGDAFLIPSPYYAAFDRDLGWRPQVRLLPVTCHSSNNFQITLAALEAAYESARKANIRVKATVFRGPSFLSVSEIIQEMECNRNLIHIVYSLSKDMGLPGFRVGIVYSYNDTVVNVGRKMSSFGLVSSETQYFLASMLADEEFVDRLSESARRLASRHESFTKGLEEVGIKCLESNAGLFCWWT
ncbi:UNVERIFIED_CONTAM: 1-aminocyclopropane-1-carboxylate synthase 1 [Sesamum angustifolium]|uniref:1-aminocyclopropane-1-carboxylate synthase 1 n=1 Tax=Sesamum angustifolium TaxID=2727405 RepID=A0AAW2RHG1_9LAMI